MAIINILLTSLRIKENTRKLNIKHGGKGFEIIRMAEKFDCKIP